MEEEDRIRQEGNEEDYMEEKIIFNKKKIFILGFGFFGVSIIWAG